MSTALGAAGNMNRKSVTAVRRNLVRNARRKGARGDVRRGADWRARAGDNVPPRIAGAHDKAKLFRSGGEA